VGSHFPASAPSHHFQHPPPQHHQQHQHHPQQQQVSGYDLVYVESVI
jgi:hypothetical protein